MNSAGNVYSVNNLKQLEEIIYKSGELNRLVILDTYAPWCGPCKTIAPFFAGLSINEHFSNWATFAKVDVDAAEDVAIYLKTKAMPTFYVFYKSLEPVATHQGANKEAIPNLLISCQHLVS